MVAPLNVLMTGNGRSGSWGIRGIQLGQAIGATVHPKARDVDAFDLAILVKRPPQDLVELLHRRKVPIVYDVVDAWPQPGGNDWDKPVCTAWLDEQIRSIAPVGIVAATEAMARDCKGYGVPVLALHHHARPGIERNPIRMDVVKVGYEGGEHYLGTWNETLTRECKARGWTFHVNPSALAEVDIVVAMREQRGYACRSWKSNVKLANAQGSGTPCVVTREAGYIETQAGGERFADTRHELREAFDELAYYAIRKAVSSLFLPAAPSLARVAKVYREWLTSNFSPA